jgi:transposase
MPLYPAASKGASSRASTTVACRCCPGGASRSTRVARYPSDMSDAEWAVTEPTLPEPAWKQGRGGRPAGHCRRDIVDAIRYLVKEGIQWRAMPADFPPWSTVYDYLAGWQESGATAALHDELRKQCRIAAGRNPEPTAAVIDSQAVKAAETVAKPGRGFDAGKKINGRKRHIAVDVMGLLLVIVVTAASVQDRDAARELLWHLRSRVRTITLVWADGGYAGKLLDWAQANLRLTVEIVKRTAAHAFVVLRRRWVVERTFAWITRSRRTVRDYERLEDHHAAMVYWSMIIIMTRRLARQTHGTKHAPPAMQKALLQAA